MAKKKKGIYFDEFMSRGYDSNALVQDYKGIVILPVAGHVYVVRTFFGFYKILHDEKKNADNKLLHSLSLKFRFPFSQVKLIKNIPTTGVIEMNDPILTTDGLNATPAPGGFEFKYEAVNDKDNYKKLYNLNGDAIKNVKASIKQIISLIVNRGEMKDVRKTFSINFSNDNWWPEWIKDPNDIDILKDMYEKIENEYGIKVTEVLAVDFNEPKRVVDANEELKAAESERKTADIRRKIVIEDNAVAIAKAADEAGLRIEEARKKAEYDAKKEADIAAAKADAEVKKQSEILNDRIAALVQYGKNNKLSETQIIKMITCVLNPNATHVDLDGAAAILKALDTNKRNVQPTTNTQQPVAQPTAQQAPVQAQQATAQAQQAPVQTQQAPAQAQSVVSQTKDTTPKKAAKAVRVYAKRSNAKTDKKNGVKGNVPTPRKHSHNQQSNGHGMNRR